MVGSEIFKIITGILLGGVFLYLAFRNVDTRKMASSLKTANYWYILLAVTSLIFSHYLRTLRWMLLLAPIKKIHSWSLFSALIIGYAANTFFPAHLGEFLRAFVIGIKHNVYTSTVFASIVLERIVDVISLLLIMVLLIIIHPFPDWLINSGLVMLIGTFLIFSTLISLKLYKNKALRIFDYLLKPFPLKFNIYVQKIIHNFLSGLIPLKSVKHYIYSALLSILIWFCYALVYYFCIQAFNLEEVYNLSWYVSLVVLVFTTISIVVPASPGYIGTYHYLCQLSLMMFGISSTEAFSYALIAHAVSIFPQTVIGLILANYEGITIFKKSTMTTDIKLENRKI